MGTTVEDLVRLAWHADGEGRGGLRDALLTLAVAESGVDDMVLAERCRRVLVAHRPDHWFAAPAPLSQSLGRPRVVENLSKLRVMFPPARVRRLLMRGEVRRGPYTGRPVPLTRALHDLAPTPPPPHVRPHAPGPDPDGSLAALYLTALFAMALLLNGVLTPVARENKAA